MKQLVKGIVFAAAALMLMQAPQAQAKVKVKKVTVKSNYGSSVHVAVGKKVKLTTTVKVSPNKSANKKVSYKSSNKKIATVSSSGYVKGIKTGKCKITVTSKKNKKKKAKITVTVVKKVTSVAIEKPKNQLYVGNSLTLKATVKPASGSYKKVTWSSSDKKIATVTKAGVVKGIKAGNVTIKATSVEGSKKKASLKMTVMATNSVGIASVEVLSNDVVRVSLDKAKALTNKQFKIEGKRYSYGTYNRTYSVSNIRNYDNRTYDIKLTDDYSVEKDSYVRVTISDLPGNGVKTMEAQALFTKLSEPKEEKWLGVVGDEWNKTVDLSEYGCGNLSYQITGEIPGITRKIKNNEITFSGTLTTVTVGTDITIKATDEMGTKFTKVIHVYIGNESAIVAKAEDMTVVTGTQLDAVTFLEVLGGSGSYSYSAISLPAGLKMDAETGTLSGKVSGVGEYRVQITVSDEKNTNRMVETSALIRVVDQRRVAGLVVDEKGAPVEGVSIVCENLTDGSIFTSTTDEKGNYVVNVGEGTYQITASLGERKDAVYQFTIGSGGRELNFTL